MYESSGPDVKIRGTASHVAEKYLQLARDAQSSGDPIAAENYYQHAEHYFRLIAAAQEQLRQSQPYYQQQQGDMRGNFGDDAFDDVADEQPHLAGEPFAPREPQPFYAREPHEPQSQPFQPRPQAPATADEDDVDRLPSFITGGQPPQQQPPQQGQAPTGANGYDGQSDRFPLHRRRRRHRGSRDHSGSNDGDTPTSSGPRSAED
jgi:hypothetical protein